MTASVVDTNVLAVANNKGGTKPSCVLACLDALEAVREGIIVLDDKWRIINEYKRYAHPSGQPGPGDAFLNWVIVNEYNPDCCELVPLTQQSNDPNDFAEFSADPALAGFDPSDRKFVAVALKSQHSPHILNAIDSDWRDAEKALQQNGIHIHFLCPDALKTAAT